MKHIQTLTLVAMFSVANLMKAADSPAGAGARADANPPVGIKQDTDKAPAGSAPSEPGAQAATSSPGAGSTVNNNASDGLRLNFRGVQLEKVLDYLSEAAGFIIVLETKVRGTVDVWSNQPLTRDEAVNLLNSVLNKNGYAAIRHDRTLTIVNKDEAKIHDIPVVQGSDPEKIPKTDEIITQIIPVRFVEVTQLIKDLQPLVSQQSTITANEAGNAIVMTDTRANIRKVAEIIKAIDLGAEEFTVLHVFRLQNADPVETADLLTSLFPDDSGRSGGNSQSPFANNPFFSRLAGRFGGFGGGGGGGGGGPGGGGGGGGAGSSSNQNQRIKKRNRVIAVADQRTASVIVSATRDLMEQIEGVVTDLDNNPKGKPRVAVIPTGPADPQQLLPLLQDIFPNNNVQNSRNQANQTSPLVNRSSTQNQQNNSGTRSSSFSPTSTGRGGSGVPSFPQ